MGIRAHKAESRPASDTVLFQRPTRLADGLGLKETAPPLLEGLHPRSWVPRSFHLGRLGLELKVEDP